MLKWLLWFALVLPIGAHAREESVDARAGHFAQTGISKEQAVDKVRRTFGGRVLSATPVDRGGKQGFKIRVLTEGGRVKNVFVDSGGRVSGN